MIYFFLILKWRKSIEVFRVGDVARGLFWAKAFEMFTNLTFYFGCCRNLHFYAVWPDIWHGNKIRQSVYKFTERQHLGFSQGINCWWDSEKHQKSILFSFLELHGSRSLKFLSLNDKTGFSTVLPVFSVVMAYMTADTQRGLPWCKAAYGLF